MAQKVTWQEPDETTVDKVEISFSATLYGSYSVIESIDATSDSAAKTAANTWVTSYTHSAGVRTNWYRVRFYDTDTTTYSEYSDPTTSEELLRLCTVADVKRVIDTVGRFTDDEIFEAITDIDQEIYIEAGTPISAMYTDIGKIDSTLQDTYYVGEENIYRVDRLFYGTVTKTEYYLDDGFKTNLNYGMIRLLPVASGGPTLVAGDSIEVQFVPKLYNRVAVYRTAKYLLERTDYATGGSTSKQLAVIEKRLEMTENLLRNRIGVKMSSDYASYDPIYGVNRKKIVQNFVKNRYIGSTGW